MGKRRSKYEAKKAVVKSVWYEARIVQANDVTGSFVHVYDAGEPVNGSDYDNVLGRARAIVAEYKLEGVLVIATITTVYDVIV